MARHFRAALALEPARPDILLQLGMTLLLNLGKRPQALQTLTQAVGWAAEPAEVPILLAALAAAQVRATVAAAPCCVGAPASCQHRRRHHLPPTHPSLPSAPAGGERADSRGRAVTGGGYRRRACHRLR